MYVHGEFFLATAIRQIYLLGCDRRSDDRQEIGPTRAEQVKPRTFRHQRTVRKRGREGLTGIFFFSAASVERFSPRVAQHAKL